VADGDLQGDGAAIAETAEVGAIDVQVLQKRRRVVG